MAQTENSAVEVPGRWETWQTVQPIETPVFLRNIVVGLVAVGGVLSVWLHFATNSLLWLDEAQSVNIASQPLRELPHYLKEDGAPPLYYALLHIWMQIFGSSDLAVRSLSGVVSLITVGVVFIVARRVWGFEVGLISAVLIATSSFATYYATETRMYALVMLLVALGVGACARLFEKPTTARLLLFAFLCAALAYTQYWSFYLFIILGIWLLAAIVRSKNPLDKKAARYGLLGLVVAAVAFLPWLPIFLYQHSHTGTPWGSPPNFLTALVAVFHFHSNQALQIAKSDVRQRGMEVVFIILFVLALFGTSQAKKRQWITWKPQPKGRLLAWIVFGTLVFGVVVSHYSNIAYTPRYGSVVYVPLMIFVAVGAQFFSQPLVRVVIVVLIGGGFLVGSWQESTTQRSQANQVVNALEQHGETGDVAIFCPDELGPTVLRIMPNNGIKNVGYPRFTNPSIVDWVDYDQVLINTNPSTFIAQAQALAGPHHVWLIWSAGYGASGPACTQVAQVLNSQSAWTSQVWVNPDPLRYFQSMQVIEYTKSSSG